MMKQLTLNVAAWAKSARRRLPPWWQILLSVLIAAVWTGALVMSSGLDAYLPFFTSNP